MSTMAWNEVKVSTIANCFRKAGFVKQVPGDVAEHEINFQEAADSMKESDSVCMCIQWPFYAINEHCKVRTKGGTTPSYLFNPIDNTLKLNTAVAIDHTQVLPKVPLLLE